MRQIFLIIAMFIFSSSFGQVDNYDLLTKNIESSNVKSITKFLESKNFPNGEKDFKLEFNQQGQLLSIEEYEFLMGPDNPIVMRQELKYNEEGIKVATHIKAPGGSTAVDTLIYNDKGDLIKKQRVANRQVVKTWDYSNKKKEDLNLKEFDDNENLVRLKEPNGNYTIYEYDSNGNLLQETKFQDEKRHTKEVFTYDNDNRLATVKTFLLYIGDGKTKPLIHFFEYEYFQ